MMTLSYCKCRERLYVHRHVVHVPPAPTRWSRKWPAGRETVPPGWPFIRIFDPHLSPRMCCAAGEAAETRALLSVWVSRRRTVNRRSRVFFFDPANYSLSFCAFIYLFTFAFQKQVQRLRHLKKNIVRILSHSHVSLGNTIISGETKKNWASRLCNLPPQLQRLMGE